MYRSAARQLRRNLVAWLALFVALGGTAFAAAKWTGEDIKDDSLTGADIVESSLASVPKAGDAAALGGLAARDFGSTYLMANILLDDPQSVGGYVPVDGLARATDTRSRVQLMMPVDAYLRDWTVASSGSSNVQVTLEVMSPSFTLLATSTCDLSAGPCQRDLAIRVNRGDRVYLDVAKSNPVDVAALVSSLRVGQVAP